MVPKVGDNCPLYDSCEINWIINTLQNKNTTETIETISLVLFVFHPTSLYLYPLYILLCNAKLQCKKILTRIIKF